MYSIWQNLQRYSNIIGIESSDFLNRMIEPLTENDKEFKKRYDAFKGIIT